MEEYRDSMGALVSPSTTQWPSSRSSSVSSPTVSVAGVTVMQRSSISEITRLVERALANCVNKPAGEIKLTVAEWHRQLSQYNSIDLHCALDEHFQSSQWWPTVHDIIKHIKLKIPPPQLQSWQEKPEPFERNGRSREEEIAYRASVVANAWRVARSENPERPDPLEAIMGAQKSREASQDMSVSDHLRHSCSARAARNEDWCGPNICPRSGVGVRVCRVDRELGLDGEA